jgi:hypothetical protein
MRGLVYEDQPLRIDFGLEARPAGASAGDVGPVPLGRREAFF